MAMSDSEGPICDQKVEGPSKILDFVQGTILNPGNGPILLL